MTALSSGGKIFVKSGTYSGSPAQCDVTTNKITIEGEGRTTILSGIGFKIMAMNVTFRNLYLTGATFGIDFRIGSGYGLCENVVFEGADNSYASCFNINPNAVTISNFKFINCHAIDCGRCGFMHLGNAASSKVTDVTYDNCSAINCGVATRFNDYVCGFDVFELCNVENITYSKCLAYGTWLNGFHMESTTYTAKNVKFVSCSSIRSGQKGANNYNYCLSGGVSLTDCYSYLCVLGVGYWIYNKDNDIHLNGCVDDGSDIGMEFHKAIGKVYVNDCVVKNCVQRGIYALDGGNIRAKNLTVLDCGNVTTTVDCPIYIGINGYPVINSTFDVNVKLIHIAGLTYGMWLRNCNNVEVTGKIVSAEHRALVVSAGADIKIHDLEIISAGMDEGIQVVGAVTNSRVWNTLISDTQVAPTLTYGVSGAGFGLIIDTKTTKVVGAITGAYDDVVKTQATGKTQFAAATTLDIAHGMGTTPTYVVVTGTDANSNALFVDTIGGTTFKVTRGNNTGVPWVHWYAEV
jgi:hypothetical protein